ncbi:MAG: response regulator transcription factor [Synechococcaceae cyanobacterium]|nr:response regulator transcription factor [Synechococcaceae cyanobacterium]
MTGNDPSTQAPESDRIWILEDDELLCELLTRRCAERGWALESFHQPRDLEQALSERTPDLLLLDHLLPYKSGLDVLAGIRRQGLHFPVLMLSALNAPGDRIAGLEYGADDYVGKPFVFRELQLRIEKLLRCSSCDGDEGPGRSGSAQPAVARSASERFHIGGCCFSPQAHELHGPDGEIVRLTRGDTALLLALCRQPDRVVSREALARACGSLVDVRQSRTIDVRMSRLRRLLHQLEPQQEHLEACRGQGYRLSATPHEASPPPACA